VLDTLLTSKLREMGYKLRKYYRERIGHHPDALEMARQEKEKMVRTSAPVSSEYQALTFPSCGHADQSHLPYLDHQSRHPSTTGSAGRSANFSRRELFR
jgi:hypothetical protein